MKKILALAVLVLGVALRAKLNQVKELHANASAELDILLPSILDKAFKGEL